MPRQKLRPLKAARGETYVAFLEHERACSACAVERDLAVSVELGCAEAIRLWGVYLDARLAVDEWQREHSHLYAGRGRGAPWRAPA